MLVIGVLGILSISAIGFMSYRLSMKNVMEEASIKSNIILNYAMASRKYMKQVQKPLVRQIVAEDRFYPELMSGFVTARGTYELFHDSFPDYIFKQATLDPLNPKNKADQTEMDIIDKFKDNSDKKEDSGIVQRDGKEVYYIAQPIKVDKASCLTCHGDPSIAPKDQIDIYGTETGYNWKMNDTVAAFIVYVPLQAALEVAKDNAISLILFAGIGVLVMLAIVWLFLDRTVVSPILHLTQVTEDLSLGKNLEQPLEYTTRTEIGTLGNSIERLRKSLVILFKKLAKK